MIRCPNCEGTRDECACFVCDNCNEVCAGGPWRADETAEHDLCLACLDVLYPPTDSEGASS